MPAREGPFDGTKGTRNAIDSVASAVAARRAGRLSSRLTRLEKRG